MANIPVQKTSRGGSFLPWLLGLLVLGLLGWGIWEIFEEDEADLAAVESTTTVVVPEQSNERTPGMMSDSAAMQDSYTMGDSATMQNQMAGAQGMTIGTVMSNPDAYVGETIPTASVQVGEVPTDRGFWITDQGERLFAVIIDKPNEQPKDINPEQTLRLKDGTLRAPSYLPDLAGRPLDQRTQAIAENEDVFLVVDERYINILEQGMPQPGTSPAQSQQ